LFITTPVVLFLLELVEALNLVNKLSLDANNLSVEFEYSYFIDDSGKESIQEVLSKPSRFIKSPLNQAKVDFGEQAYWHHLKIRNVKNAQRTLSVLFDNPMLDYVDVYKIDGDQFTLIEKLGDHRTYLSLEQMSFPNISISLEPSESSQLLVRAQTTGAPNLPFAVFDQNEFERYKNVVYLLWGAFIGVVVLMTVYNLILYIGVSEKLYLLYIGYIVAFLLELGEVHGYNAYLVSPEMHHVLGKNIITINYLIGYFTMLFALYFFQFDKEPKNKLTIFTRFYANVFLVCSVLSLFIVEYVAAQIFFSMQIILYIVAITMMSIRYRQGIRWAKFYVISWFPLFVGAAVGPMLLTGNLEYSFWARHALLLGVMFEMTFISMALAERLRMSESERLYEASHDHIFGFANSSLLEKKSREFVEQKSAANFSIVVIVIDKYESIVPYLSAENLKKLVYQFATDVEQHLASQLLLVEVDDRSSFKNSVMIREGVFGFLVLSNDDALVSKVLDDFTARQPISYQLDDVTINLNCIMGTAAYTDGCNDPHLLINQAQQAVDSAIENNRSSWVYSAAQKSEEGRKVKLASDLQLAIDSDELELFHQPQIDIKNGAVIGSEVLLRWRHPQLGFISPDEFVTIAENTGLINQLSHWVFKTSCQQMLMMKEKQIEGYRISVNFSAYDVMLDSFVSSLVEQLTHFGLKADMFTLELTETVSVTDTQSLDKNLIELKDLGFNIAIDDFGTGYSSLTYVSQHPFDELKIDRDFVTSLATSPKHQSIVQATINMASSLGIDVVAEGVSDTESFRLLSNYGCAIGQGYLFSKPLPVDEYLEWLDEYNINHYFETAV